jgi:ribose-phosphate pyrophosphokinase
MDRDELVLFSLGASREFGEKVGRQLGVVLSEHEERDFEDGEHKSRPLVNVRGQDVFVIHSLYGDFEQTANDKLCRLLFFLGALRDASAGRVTAVVPYLCYARKDRKTKSRDPVTTRYVARLFEAMDIDRLVTLDVHNLAAFQNAFRRPTEHLEAKKLFVEHFAPLLGDDEVVVVSPDVGGIKRAEAFREDLERTLGRPLAGAFMQKKRSGGVVSGNAVVGDVQGRTAIILDDLISSGTTLARAAEACQTRGANRIFAAASHGVFVGKAGDVLDNPALEQIVVTDTIPPFRLEDDLIRRKLTILNAAGLFAEAIRRMHEGGSIVELLEA